MPDFDTSVAQAQVKKPALMVNTIAAAATGSILVSGTWISSEIGK